MQVHPQPVRLVGEGAQLVGGVDGAQLGALRDADHLGLGVVLDAEAVRSPGHQRRGEFAVRGVHGQRLDAGQLLRCTALVYVDVGRPGADHGVPAVGQHRQRHDVGPGAGEDRVGGRLFPEVTPEHLLEPCGVRNLAVAHHVAVVRGDDRLDHFRMGAGDVVGGEAVVGRIMQRCGHTDHSSGAVRPHRGE
ncbi:hypothetical protein SDC9_109908 [bioreactor metagenome]|uniref:Uncharacterized protein n=1 Tax=bioreactor metagenome TaxID=1076179 RepID=A0A645BC40_9ZZZZ